MFRGVNTLNLDAKGRMAMPSRYRDQLSEQSDGKLIVTVDRDHCLLLYPLPEWEEIERKLVRLPSLNKQARRMQRLLIGHATDCDLDNNGRLLLPPPLREFANLEKRIVLIGQGNKFEIWDEDKWSSKRDEWLQESDDDDLDLPDELESLSL
ncbi:Cell division protein MraZ [hydrothermal vent metagenome]|uniref:Transcriptional regulator MraZ n=1 Tax=hydrothermal vent metagenome TaxID=652676 RepID=A0A3B1AID1_9ZZZZ